ncbi:DUF4432 family protein [Gramella sp. AN32]|uniref:DUF4432 family protein n=1 Tax=Christiangramia antarctica TaxID=2058158 RepID=A0ABW5XAF9_9FLAO|nr:DUF4432 family protein [Gramella sp. AN32]MCM4157579.1 hypothetical protein [Gramella sp. AN32]
MIKNNDLENSCSVSDEWTYKEMQVVYLENNFLRIGILVGRGSDIFEFRYKPKDIDPLLRLPKGIRNPLKEYSQMQNPAGKFEEYYYGGWQEVLPNSPVFNYRGKILGQHGETSLNPWKYSIIKDTKEEVVVKVWTELLCMPLLLEKTLCLKQNDTRLYISEKLTNKGKTTLDIMWGHHIAFGLPFIKEGVTIETNAKTFIAESLMPSNRRFKPDKKFKWPIGENIDGAKDDASLIPDENGASYSELCYLEGYEKDAYYTIKNKEKNLSFNVKWNGNMFKCLWIWEERYAAKDFPWWGDCYTVALEPWTSSGTNNPDKAIENSEWLKIKSGETIETNLCAGIFEDT